MREIDEHGLMRFVKPAVPANEGQKIVEPQANQQQPPFQATKRSFDFLRKNLRGGGIEGTVIIDFAMVVRFQVQLGHTGFRCDLGGSALVTSAALRLVGPSRLSRQTIERARLRPLHSIPKVFLRRDSSHHWPAPRLCTYMANVLIVTGSRRPPQAGIVLFRALVIV